MFKSKSSGGGLHIMSRLWWLFLTFLGLIFLVVSYNFAYDHASKKTQHQWDTEREWVVDHIPDYHPKKNTKGTRHAQSAEHKLKQRIKNRGE